MSELDKNKEGHLPLEGFEGLTNIESIVERLIDTEFYVHQTELINKLLKKNILSLKDIRNLRNRQKRVEQSEFDWNMVTDFLAEQLEKVGALVIISEYGCWWGIGKEEPYLYWDRDLSKVAKNILEGMK